MNVNTVVVVVGFVVVVVVVVLVVVVVISRHSAVHWAPVPTLLLSDVKITLSPFLAAFPVKLIASGIVVPQVL